MRTYFVEFTFDFWEILYTEEGVYEGATERIFSTGEGSNDSRGEATARLHHLIATNQMPKGKIVG